MDTSFWITLIAGISTPLTVAIYRYGGNGKKNGNGKKCTPESCEMAKSLNDNLSKCIDKDLCDAKMKPIGESITRIETHIGKIFDILNGTGKKK